MSKICKNCEEKPAVQYSKYSNGEHCSRECARAYSTKLKRKEISEKVSKTLTGTGNDDVTKNCPTCKKDFTMKFKRRHKVFCSPSCSNNNDAIKEKIGKAVSDVKNGRTKVKHPKENEIRRLLLEKWNEENNYVK